MKPASLAACVTAPAAPVLKPRKRLRQLGLAIALAVGAGAFHGSADAAGLGPLRLLSGIGQPLRAEIELTSIGRDEGGTLSARLASADAYGQAGIEYGGALPTLRFSIQRRAGGQPYVLVTSTQVVNDPFLDILVELNFGSGRLVREYTMLLDPPESRPARAEVDPGQTLTPAQSSAPVARRGAASPRRAASSEAASVAPSTATPAAASASSTPGTDYVVRNGDTAMSISRSAKAEGVSIEQTLAALYRDNPRAFNGNINRLLAGATVKLPDATTAQAINGAEAARIVGQSTNFARYRERLAQNASTATAAGPATSRSSGRLTTAVQDNAAPAGEARDRLQLTRPDATKTTPAAPAAAARSGVGVPSAEETAAKERELQESRARLVQLEKNVTDLQELLKLKNQTLADLQKGAAAKTTGTAPADAAPAPAAAPATAPNPASTVLTATPSAAATPAAAIPPAPPAATDAPVPAASTPMPVATPPAATPASAQPPAPPPVVKPAVAPRAPETAWYEDLFGNTLALIGLGVLAAILLGYGLYTFTRRRKLSRFEDSIFVDNSVLHANSVFGTTGGQSVDTANSGFHSNFVPVGGALPEQSEVDPVAEADVYIAYGREAQAEEILKEALRADPARHAVRLKLLEIYAKRGDAKTFETLATELYAATGGHGNDWEHAAHLGLSVDPRNALYAQAGTGAPASTMPFAAAGAAAIAAAGAAGLSHASAAPSYGEAARQAAASVLGHGVPDLSAPATATEFVRTEPLPRTPPPLTTPEPSMDLDFDLGTNAQRAAKSGATNAPAESAAPTDDHDPLIEPFSASAFAATDVMTRTAVNLPAFRARTEPPATSEAPPAHTDTTGFTASDIFGSSIVADTEPHTMTQHEPPLDHPPMEHVPTSSNFRADGGRNDFEKTEPFDSSFGKINLDLDGSDFAASGVHSDVGGKTEVWQAMATKLDLALAYSDIGDKDGARELLDEVVRSGDSTQAERAKHLITQLA